jgi:hypothetical protein
MMFLNVNWKVRAIGKTFSFLGMSSSSYHASKTDWGLTLDVKTFELIPWIAYQEIMKNLPSDNPARLHDLSEKPR